MYTHETPFPSHTASCGKICSAPVTVINSHWPDSLAAISHLKIPVRNVHKSSGQFDRCIVLSARAPEDPVPTIYNEITSVFPVFHWLACMCCNALEEGLSGRVNLDLWHFISFDFTRFLLVRYMQMYYRSTGRSKWPYIVCLVVISVADANCIMPMPLQYFRMSFGTTRPSFVFGNENCSAIFHARMWLTLISRPRWCPEKLYSCLYYSKTPVNYKTMPKIGFGAPFVIFL